MLTRRAFLQFMALLSARLMFTVPAGARLADKSGMTFPLRFPMRF